MQNSELKNIDELFEDVQDLLYNLAWKFAQRYGMDFEDALSDAYEGFMKAVNNYRAGRGMKFSTWCHFVAWGHMKSLLMHRLSKKKETVELNEQIIGKVPEPVSDEVLRIRELALTHKSISKVIMSLFMESPREILRTIDSLSEEARELLMLFSSRSGRPPIRNRNVEVAAIKQEFEQVYGRERTERAYKEVRMKFAETWS